MVAGDGDRRRFVTAGVAVLRGCGCGGAAWLRVWRRVWRCCVAADVAAGDGGVAAVGWWVTAACGCGCGSGRQRCGGGGMVGDRGVWWRVTAGCMAMLRGFLPIPSSKPSPPNRRPSRRRRARIGTRAQWKNPQGLGAPPLDVHTPSSTWQRGYVP